MGGGASSAMADDLLSTTMMIGRAIAAITFPGMFRIYDFHSAKAPKLKNQRQFTFFAPDSDDDEDDDDEEGGGGGGAPDPSEYEHFFNVMVGEDRIYLEDPTYVNDAGWTALHTCCMSFLTVQAGLALIEETTRRGKSIDVTTLAGPGTFNSQWTPLHMACAYGISPLVEKLVEEGANVNTSNSFGYTPLLEACHRGFLNIVEVLVKAGADARYIPSDEDSFQSPFVSAPAQSALGESARCGFVRICQALLDADAPKDQTNSLGWTPLHEACFYNRIEGARMCFEECLCRTALSHRALPHRRPVVKLLLLSGANASARTRGGALPYHLAGLQFVRTMIADMGGPGAVPEEGDTIDMVSVLRELTMPDCCEMVATERPDGAWRDNCLFFSCASLAASYDVPPCVLSDRTGSVMMEYQMKGPVAAATDGMATVGGTPSASGAKRITDGTSASGAKASSDRERNRDSKAFAPDEKASPQALLHSGRILGDLPSLPGAGKSPASNSKAANAASMDLGRALQYGDASPDMRADGKDRPSNTTSSSGGAMTIKKKKKAYQPPPGMPTAYLCQLSHRPMSEPVKTTYGHCYDKKAMENWMRTQGHICPLTGAPLAESDLKPMPELGDEIREWILRNAQRSAPVDATSPAAASAAATAAGAGVGPSNETAAPRRLAGPAAADTDDLYDF